MDLIYDVKYKSIYGISKQTRCINWKRFKRLFLLGDYETLGEECYHPNDCLTCSRMLKRCEMMYYGKRK